VAKELVRYRLDLLGVQELKLDKGAIVRAEDYASFYGKGNEHHELKALFFLRPRIAAAKRVVFVSDRVPYIVLRGGWCNMTALNVHAPTEEKNDESKVMCYKELEQMFDYFPKCHMKFHLGDFNAKFWRKVIFKPKTGNESLHGDINKNGVTAVNFST
jgi:hypothetical protein